jgi:hypothetical protein
MTWDDMLNGLFGSTSDPAQEARWERVFTLPNGYEPTKPIVLHYTPPKGNDTTMSMETNYYIDARGVVYDPQGRVVPIDRVPVNHLDSIIEQAQAIRDRLARYGEDVYEDGAVLRFDKQFTPIGKTYSYAVIKAGGLWHKTGRQERPITWTQLCEFWASAPIPVDEIWHVVEYERHGDD